MGGAHTGCLAASLLFNWVKFLLGAGWEIVLGMEVTFVGIFASKLPRLLVFVLGTLRVPGCDIWEVRASALREWRRVKRGLGLKLPVAVSSVVWPRYSVEEFFRTGSVRTLGRLPKDLASSRSVLSSSTCLFFRSASKDAFFFWRFCSANCSETFTSLRLLETDLIWGRLMVCRDLPQLLLALPHPVWPCVKPQLVC